MNRIKLLALGLLSLGLATSASAQTKVTKLIIQNATGTTNVSQTANGVLIDNNLILQNPTSPTSLVTLQVPASLTNTVFTFPSVGGTLLTGAATNTNGDAMIAAINAATTGVKIDAAHLDLSSLGLGSVSTVAAGDLTLNISTTLGAVTATLNLNHENTWLQTQTFPTTINQGNALINSINAGNISLTGYATTASLANFVTNSSLTTTLNSYVTNSSLTSQLANYVTLSNIGSSLPNVNAAPGTYTNATVTVDAKGRVTSASNGLSITGISALISGKVSVVRTATKVADITVTNAAINANSLILVSTILNGTSTEEQYVSSLVSQTAGSMVLRAQRNGGGSMSPGEGCTISYMIINP